MARLRWLGLLLIAGSATSAAAPVPTAWETLQVPAPGVATVPLRVRVLVPPGYRADAPIGYAVLYVNDGQDMEAVGLRPTLAALEKSDAIRPPIVVAIDMPPDRMGAYGMGDRAAGRSLVAETKYGPVGALAQPYSEWLAHTLVPLIDARYHTRTTADARAVLGWSLGALNAFSVGWQYPEVFGRVGAFSPSLWLAADRSSDAAVQRTRLAQTMVGHIQPHNKPRMFFAVGDREETSDRDGDGVIDVLDDARDLIGGWPGDDHARAQKGLAQLGYSVNRNDGMQPGRADVTLLRLPLGEHNQKSWARMLPVFLRWAYAIDAPPLQATGTTVSWQDVPSAHVAARDVDIWLPPGYAQHPGQRYPVLYMHDGQNLFDPALSYTGIDWGIDETMTRLISDGKIRAAIVVGIWNTPLRLQEYMPRKAVRTPSLQVAVDGVPPLSVDQIVSDNYLRFLVDELKPAIDARFRTLPGRANTFIMGSSMGGLISLYAISEYPQVFGGAAGISTHWPIGDGVFVDWLGAHLPDPATHKVYFDHGTATLDAGYAQYQQRMDAWMRRSGYVEGHNWDTRVFEGADHSERSWRARVEEPLQFLIGK